MRLRSSSVEGRRSSAATVGRLSSMIKVTPKHAPSLVNDSEAITWLSEKTRNMTMSRLSLPYSRTPAGVRPMLGFLQKSIQHRARIQPGPDTRDLDSIWKGLLNKTWHMYKVSPMHLFSFESSALNTYAKLLSAHLQSIRTKSPVFVEDNIGVVKIQASKNEDFIEVVMSQGRQSGGRVLLTALLFSAKTDSEKSDLDESFVLMPLMLIKGSSTLVTHFINWWQVHFDSCITKLIVSSMQLMWLATVFAGITTGSQSKPVEFVYKVPGEVKGLSTITLSVNAHDCQKIWHSIRGNECQDDVITSEQVVAFISAWDEHFFHYFGVRLQALHLFTVGTAIVHACTDGRLKIYSAEHALQLLVYLADEALKQNFA